MTIQSKVTTQPKFKKWQPVLIRKEMYNQESPQEEGYILEAKDVGDDEWHYLVQLDRLDIGLKKMAPESDIEYLF